MAQNITIAGVSYPDVPSVNLAKTGGGTAPFVDISDTTATAADVKSGKDFYLADGTPASGALEWNWMGDTWELIDDNVYSSSEYLIDTAYATWTPSTTAVTLEASRNLTARAIDLANYEYLIRWRFDSLFYYPSGTTMKAAPIHQSIEAFQVIMKRPSSLTNLQSETFNGNACITMLTAPVMDYYNSSGTHTVAWTASYGIYSAVTAATFSNSTSNTPNLTIKTPSVSAKCSNTYFSAARGANVDQERSSYKVTGMLYRTSKGGAVRSIYGNTVSLYNNPLPREAITVTVRGTSSFTVSGDVSVDFGNTTSDYSGDLQTVNFSYSDADDHTINITGYLTDINFLGCMGLVSVDTAFPKSMRQKTSFASCFSGCSSLVSIPSDLFDSCASATSFSNCFNGCIGLTEIPSGLFDGCTGATNFGSCFYGCRSLTSIPSGLFDNCTAVTTFTGAFSYCTGLTSIPSGLFDSCTQVASFTSCFTHCTSLNAVPSGLFDNNTAATTFDWCFEGCTSLSSIPSGLFDNNTAATDFANCFRGLTQLSAIPSGLFDNCTGVTSFKSCFYGCSALSGMAPELWDATIWSSVTYYAACFSGCTGLTNYSDIPSGWKSGRPEPEPPAPV